MQVKVQRPKPIETRKGEISTGDLCMKLRSTTFVPLLTNFRRKRPVIWLYGCYIGSSLHLRDHDRVEREREKKNEG